ncbi:LOW QUALITY PROTEIN: rho GTPase-activating protein SYDE1 [Rissa tridactyla]|uniref:LOW QUALITY PROTEIN: rho GTPase-activating protein SYDE1 n=1 Tax=Rissa tridactyla TaxID=75485 RepID=UPI0023BB1A5C|nr:LOW QUALITY PROTEIN: rho GTPase-activating protein SYDE1 [Rissa tridactyla]
MAEPLLRRTFSRLRGRDRPRGKKSDGKDREHPPPSPDSPVDPEAALVEPVPVATRKQNWARFSCGGRDERPPKSSPDLADTGELDPAAGSPQPGVEPPSEEEMEPAEEAEAVNGSGELGGPGRSPGHGAYLQSLERSSRHWVLSSVKGLGLDEPGSGAEADTGAAGSEGEIWYNPIPEDEDPQPGSSWQMWGRGSRDAERGRGGESPPKMGREEPPRGGLGTVEGSGPRGGTAPALPTAGRGEEPGAGRTQACGKMPIPCVSSGTGLPTPSPPPSPKKGRSLNKVKSPGTVRRLSMKMKKLPELRRKLSLRSPRPRGQEGGTSPSESRKESSNVISRYHLDSSVASRPGLPRAKAAGKGGYLSDGDSPELPAKAGMRGEAENGENGLDVGAFRPYSCGETPPRCGQHISGLVSVHLHGVRDLKPPRAEAREVFCVLQVDAANRARTALLPCKTAFLGLNHTFNLELEGARHLKVIVFSWDPTSCRNRLCCHGTVVLPHIFRGCRAQQLAVRLQPRGVLYSKFTLVEQWENPSEREPRVFGVELGQLVEREKTATKVPLLIQKCVAEIEKRGLKVVGLYRLCGSAAVKKELRDAFERDSAAVTLSEQLYPDINVITGILKDYLRELPTPLITPHLYHVVLEAMAKRPPRAPPAERDAVTLLDCLPAIEKATLTRLLDHLTLVASFHDFNRMNSQNIAVCFGPVLLTQNQEPRCSGPGTRGYAHCEDIASAVDFKRHIEVLHYLLQAWPAPRSALAPQLWEGAQPGCPQQQRGPALRLDLLENAVVARHRPRGPESPPSNRYAGDWSICDHQFLLVPGAAGNADYDEAATGDDDSEVPPRRPPHQRTLLVADFALGEEPEAAFGPRLNLKDFDALILDLERELSKQINVCL